jgi:hypothetical protein
MHTPFRIVLGAIGILATIAALAISAVTKNVEFVYYSLWMVVFISLVWRLDRKAGVPTAICILLVAWLVLHFVGGIAKIPEHLLEPGAPNTLYNMRVHPSLPKYDQVVHAFGFFSATLTAWCGMRAAIGKLTRPSQHHPVELTEGRFWALFLTGMGLGAMNEVIEFVATVIFPWTNVGGYVNTGWDLVSNMVGCVLACALVWALEKRSTWPKV